MTPRELLALLKRGPVRATALADPEAGDLTKIARQLHGLWVAQPVPIHRTWDASEYVYRLPDEGGRQ